MTENDSIAKIKDDIVRKYGEDRTWFCFENVDGLPNNFRCKIMFVAERPSGSKERKMSTFTEQRFCLFQKLRKEIFSTTPTYATDCIKTYPINRWKDGLKRKRENERDFEEQRKYLKREIDCVKPSVIVPLGNEAERLIKKCVKEWEEFNGVKLLDKIWHYSYRFPKDFTRKYQERFRVLKEKIDRYESNK